MYAAAVVENDHLVAQGIVTSVRTQMQRFKEHNLTPMYVLMNLNDYKVLGCLVGHETCHNSDQDSINGLPIVICDYIREATVTTKPSDLIKNGLL